MHLVRRFYQQTTQRPRAYSLVDIGRGTIKAAVVQVKPESPEVEVIGCGLVETGEHDITGGRLEASEVANAVNIALTLAEDQTETVLGQKIVPDDVIFAVAGQATVGKLFTVRQSRSDPTKPISKKELRRLRVKAERIVQRGLSDLQLDGGRWKALAVNDVGLRLDNHLVLDGLGRTGRELSLSLFGVAAQSSAWRALEEVAKRLDLMLIEIVAASQALASLVPQPEATVLDVGFSGTTICLIKNDALVATVWVPFGDNFFIQALGENLDIGFNDTKRLKQGWINGELGREEANYLDTQLDYARQRWYEAVMAALLKFTQGGSLPWRIYVTGGGSLLPGLETLLVGDPTPFNRSPEVVRLGSRLIGGIKDLTQGLNYDLFALTLSLVVGLPDK